MSKYIDAEKLIAEIERRIEETKSMKPAFDQFWAGQISAFKGAIKIITSLQQEQTPTEREIAEAHRYAEMIRERDKARIQQEQPKVDLEKFTDKIKTFQERYKYPEVVSIKGAMAFMARMFYQYPNVARQWYEQLPKATMD